MKIPAVAAAELSRADRRTDGRTDRHDEANRPLFAIFARAPKIH